MSDPSRDDETVDHAPPELDVVGDDEAPEGVDQIDPVFGLMDPDKGANSPTSDTEAPAPGL